MNGYRWVILSLFTLYFFYNLGYDTWLYTFPHNKNWGITDWNYLYNLVYGAIYIIGGVISVCCGFISGFKSNLGKFLVFFGLGLISMAIGQVIWTYFNIVAKIPIPTPSWADIAYCAVYPFFYIGTFYLIMVYKSLVSKKLLRDTIIILVVCIGIVFGFIARPDLSSDQTLPEKILNVFYPLGDTLNIVCAIIALRVGGGKIHFRLYIFSAGLLLQGVADILFTYRSGLGTYWNGDIVDLLFTCSAYLISLGLFEIWYNLRAHTVTSKVSSMQPAVALAVNPLVPNGPGNPPEPPLPQSQTPKQDTHIPEPAVMTEPTTIHIPTQNIPVQIPEAAKPESGIDNNPS